MLGFLRDPLWQGIGVIITLLLGFIGFYYNQRQKIWLYLCATVVLILVGISIGTVLSRDQVSVDFSSLSNASTSPIPHAIPDATTIPTLPPEEINNWYKGFTDIYKREEQAESLYHGKWIKFNTDVQDITIISGSITMHISGGTIFAELHEIEHKDLSDINIVKGTKITVIGKIYKISDIGGVIIDDCQVKIID